MTLSLACVITGLDVGGAETMLSRLLSGIDRTRFRPRVISLIEPGAIGDDLRAMGIPVSSLHMTPGRPNPLALWRLIRAFQEDPPDVVHTWMYHADLLGGIAARWAGRLPVIWCIRHSDLGADATKPLTALIVRACARLSRRLPARIVCCSDAAKDIHVEAGYTAETMTVIANGLDTSRYHPDPTARRAMRTEWGVEEHQPVIGMVARVHPQKDHRTFCRAAGQLAQVNPSATFVLCGVGADWANDTLVRWIDDAGIRSRCRLLGRRRDIPDVMNGCDVATLTSSSGEAFPNVVAEAMSCGVPCVVTDVGDAATIVGETGLVVKPRDASALAKAWQALLVMDTQTRRRLGEAARQRVVERYGLADIVRRYEQVYEDVLDQSLHHPRRGRPSPLRTSTTQIDNAAQDATSTIRRP